MFYRSHTVYKLPIHLSNEQMVYFEQGNEAEALLAADLKDSMLLGWFKLNLIYPEACHLKYIDIPEFYCWNRSKHEW